MPALVLAGKFPMHQAVGTALLIMPMTSFSGFLSHLSFGSIDLTIVLIFALGGSAGIFSGTALADRTSERELIKAFGFFTIFVALYLLYANIFG